MPEGAHEQRPQSPGDERPGSPDRFGRPGKFGRPGRPGRFGRPGQGQDRARPGPGQGQARARAGQGQGKGKGKGKGRARAGQGKAGQDRAGHPSECAGQPTAAELGPARPKPASHVGPQDRTLEDSRVEWERHDANPIHSFVFS